MGRLSGSESIGWWGSDTSLVPWVQHGRGRSDLGGKPFLPDFSVRRNRCSDPTLISPSEQQEFLHGDYIGGSHGQEVWT
jgi:hypothetical protein